MFVCSLSQVQNLKFLLMIWFFIGQLVFEDQPFKFSFNSLMKRNIVFTDAFSIPLSVNGSYPTLCHCGLYYHDENCYIMKVITLLLLYAVESSSVSVSLGKFKSSPTFDPETLSIKLVYEGGDECPHGSTNSKYSANITLQCSTGYKLLFIPF